MNDFKKTTLDNGVRLITAPLEQGQTATIIAMFATGSRYETKEINGMSHFLEHMFFKGTEKRPTSLDITKELDGVGAEFNAFTSKDHTAYYIKVAHHHLPLAIDVVSDMLLNSKFDETELNKEKGVIVEEINMYEDNPLMYIHDIFEEEMYKNRIHISEKELKSLKPGEDKELEIRNNLTTDKENKETITSILNDIKETEKNSRLRQMMGLKD